MPRFKTVRVILSTGFYMLSFLLVVKENIAFIYVQYKTTMVGILTEESYL